MHSGSHMAGTSFGASMLGSSGLGGNGYSFSRNYSLECPSSNHASPAAAAASWGLSSNSLVNSARDSLYPMTMPLDNSSSNRLPRSNYLLAHTSQVTGGQLPQQPKSYDSGYQQPMAYQPKTQQPVSNSSHLMNYGIDSSDYYYNPAYAVSTAALCQSQGDHHLDYSHINADTSEDPTYVSDVHKAVEVADASLVSTSACLPGTSGKSSLFGAGLAASPVISGDPA
ncbi:hypothetical protein GGI02_005271, partial [Coemansia sp. RSA 2322]